MADAPGLIDAPAERPATRIAVGSREEAESLLDAIEGTMAELSGLLDREASAIAEGHVAAGLSGEAVKTSVAGAYLRGLEAAKANAVALARLVPDRLPALREAQTRLQEAAERNAAVLATAKAISESLLRGLAEELARAGRPVVYESAGRLAPAPRGRAPLAVSRTY